MGVAVVASRLDQALDLLLGQVLPSADLGVAAPLRWDALGYCPIKASGTTSTKRDARSRRQGLERRRLLDGPLPSILVERVGVRQDFRRLTITVYEQKVNSAVRRGLLQRSDRGDPGAVISALFVGCFSDHTIHWLHQRGYLPWADRGIGEAIIGAVNELIGRGR
jgi:hypothetical protein